MYELAGCEGVLLREIAMPEMKRADIAETYGMALRSRERDCVDWGKAKAKAK